ncbi:hypothetical protein OROGR_015092 [Orobanche gracilis]
MKFHVSATGIKRFTISSAARRCWRRTYLTVDEGKVFTGIRGWSPLVSPDGERQGVQHGCCLAGPGSDAALLLYHLRLSFTIMERKDERGADERALLETTVSYEDDSDGNCQSRFKTKSVSFEDLVKDMTLNRQDIKTFAVKTRAMKYFRDDWLKNGVGRVAPHNDVEISTERNKCFRCYFPNGDDRRNILITYAKFSSIREEFGDFDSINDMGEMDPSCWWLSYGADTPMLKSIAMKLLGQPTSSSCCENTTI